MISEVKYEELVKKGFSLDVIFILLNVMEGGGIVSSSSPKIQNTVQLMIRKGLLSDEHKLTIEGEDLLKFLDNEEEVKIVKKKPSPDAFIAFWKTFPPSDTFTYRGKKFEGSRALKSKKEDCKIKLNKILNEGEYTIEQIIEALKLEVYQKMEQSYKTGQNKISYLQNSCTWLNQRGFESYIELLNQGFKAPDTEVKQSTETYI